MTPPSIVPPHGPGNHEALSVPNTHRGRKRTREWGVRENERKSATFCQFFFLISMSRFSSSFIEERMLSGKSFLCLGKKRERALHCNLTPTVPRLECTVFRKQFSNLATCSWPNPLSTMSLPIFDE